MYTLTPPIQSDGLRYHLAAPQVCPASYAAVFWDQHFNKRIDPSEVKFVRVPNN